jgi:hypothetical protein
MQLGSVVQDAHKNGPSVWQVRWSEKDSNGQRIYRKRVVGTIDQYTDEAAVRHAASGLDVYTQAVGPAKRAAQAAVLSLFLPLRLSENDEIIGTA